MRPLNVLHIDSSGLGGGAGRAAYRIHRGLLNSGIHSSFLTQAAGNAGSSDDTVLGPAGGLDRAMSAIRPYLERNYLRYFLGGYTGSIFSPAWLSLASLRDIVQQVDPDIVHLHWVCNSIMRPEDLRQFERPIVWTLHDMWPFTGGCHYAGNCLRYRQSCGECEQLLRSGPNDISKSLHDRKQKAWEDLDITVASPSRWLADCARQSSLFRDQRIETVPTGLDLSGFKPGERRKLRGQLGLPLDKKLVLFGAIKAAGDKRKGFDLLHKAILSLGDAARTDVEIVVFGSDEPKDPPDFGLPVHYLGNIKDDDLLASVYSAADVMVVPSREDNLPNTVVESIACGTPVVAFDIGGLPDMVDHQENGFLATGLDPGNLAEGIRWVLEDVDRLQQLSISARQKAETKFNMTDTVHRYHSLYKSMVVTSKVDREPG